MEGTRRSPRNFHRLLMLPAVGALAAMWGLLAWFTISERAQILERAHAQLASTIETLADFGELERSAAASGRTGEASAGGGSTAAIWRALLQYPSAHIWMATDGVTTVGEPPPQDGTKYIQADEIREHLAAHIAMPQKDALADWQRSELQRAGSMLLVSVAFLLLMRFLSRAQQESAAAEQESLAAKQRATQLAAYGEQLEHTVTERTGELTEANSALGRELVERKAAETALREHDALLNMVTKSAAELLGSHHDDSVQLVLELVGKAVGVGRVQLTEIGRDNDDHLRSWMRHEWCAEGLEPMINKAFMQNVDHTLRPYPLLAPVNNGEVTSFSLDDMTGTFRSVFEPAQMRSFLQIPVFAKQKLWGALSIVDSGERRREWRWAETDTLKTLADLIGVAITRAQYVRELADANMIVQNSPTILYRLRGEPTFPLIYISHNITKFGHDPLKLVGTPGWMHAIIDPEDQPKVEAAMARVLEKDAQAASIEFRMRTGDGSKRWVENRYTPVRDRDGRLSEVEGIIIDITERKAAEEQISLLARTDSLTGLANRATFSDRLRQQFAASRRGASAFAILYLDVDHFKDVNDTLGHGVGDMLLREIAERLRRATRDSDLVARLGGDEFAVIQADMGEPSNAGTLAGKIRSEVAKPYLLDGNNVNITVSIGICPYVPGSTGPEQMLAQADLALYRSKDEGRDQYHFHTDDLDQEVLERVRVADELRMALENDELQLYYQPQVEVSSGRIIGMEALLRWQRPSRGILDASEFVPVAEKAGLMMPLGHWVLDVACRQMSVWQKEGVAPPVISINLSLSQLKSNGELVRDVIEITNRYGVSPSRLEFDVTEATLAQATWTQNDVLTQLHEIGARIAIDDFGTEYSSFDYVKSYHVSHLKIAQSFISGAVQDPRRAATIRAIVNIARELDIDVMAEGVETEEQRSLLAATGATTHAQGYFFSEAVDAVHAGQMLRQGSMKPLPPQDESSLAHALLAGGGRSG